MSERNRKWEIIAMYGKEKQKIQLDNLPSEIQDVIFRKISDGYVDSAIHEAAELLYTTRFFLECLVNLHKYYNDYQLAPINHLSPLNVSELICRTIEAEEQPGIKANILSFLSNVCFTSAVFSNSTQPQSSLFHCDNPDHEDDDLIINSFTALQEALEEPIDGEDRDPIAYGNTDKFYFKSSDSNQWRPLRDFFTIERLMSHPFFPNFKSNCYELLKRLDRKPKNISNFKRWETLFWYEILLHYAIPLMGCNDSKDSSDFSTKYNFYNDFNFLAKEFQNLSLYHKRPDGTFYAWESNSPHLARCFKVFLGYTLQRKKIALAAVFLKTLLTRGEIFSEKNRSLVIANYFPFISGLEAQDYFRYSFSAVCLRELKMFREYSQGRTLTLFPKPLITEGPEGEDKKLLLLDQEAQILVPCKAQQTVDDAPLLIRHTLFPKQSHSDDSPVPPEYRSPGAIQKARKKAVVKAIGRNYMIMGNVLLTSLSIAFLAAFFNVSNVDLRLLLLGGIASSLAGCIMLTFFRVFRNSEGKIFFNKEYDEENEKLNQYENALCVDNLVEECGLRSELAPERFMPHLPKAKITPQETNRIMWQQVLGEGEEESSLLQDADEFSERNDSTVNHLSLEDQEDRYRMLGVLSSPYRPFPG